MTPANIPRRESFGLNTVQCFNCGQLGHVFKQCPRPQIVAVGTPVYSVDYQQGVSMISPYYMYGPPSPQYGGAFTGYFDLNVPNVSGLQTIHAVPICYSCGASGHKVR